MLCLLMVICDNNVPNAAEHGWQTSKGREGGDGHVLAGIVRVCGYIPLGL